MNSQRLSPSHKFTGQGQTTATYANTSEALPISVNGTYGDQVSYKLDGATHQDSVSNLNAIFLDPDDLAEFSVQTNNFDARYGGAAGAVVNIVTFDRESNYGLSGFDTPNNFSLWGLWNHRALKANRP